MKEKCDIAVCDWLNKFYSFQLLYMTPAIDKMDGRGLIKTTCRECLPATEGLPERCSASVIKVSGRVHSNAFSFTVIISA